MPVPHMKQCTNNKVFNNRFKVTQSQNMQKGKTGQNACYNGHSL